MDQQRWKQIDSLLVSASELAPEERDAFLIHACAGDAELEREVRSLLASQKNAKSFLEGPAIDVVAQALAGLPEAIPADAADLEPGHVVSHYRIERKLGSGGMGVVYHARDTRLERHVALKFLSGEMARDPQSIGRFLREARAASALNHPNIITVYDIGTFDNAGHAIDFIAMEYVPGSTWEQLVSGKGLPLADLVHYATQVADALAAAHAAGIVHRDLKPGNLMVNENGCVKVLDFGLAKIGARSGTREAALTGSLESDQGLIRGTVSYMSPEQAEGKKVDARSDIFSFGAVLYEMITARHAFPGDSVASILSAILRDDPVPPSQIRPGLPRDLDRILSRCLQKDPGRRYQHAGDLKIDLQQIIPNRPAHLLPRRLWLLSAIGACVAVSLAGAWLLHSPKAAAVSWTVTRLTSEAGLSGSPALSPDGKLVAYSSDRGLDNGQDLYLQDVAGGQTIRLTSDGMGNTTPDFSPDGARIVFRSNRDGGGIYVIPASGGEARLLAKDGLNPRFSPDGSHVAYWVGAHVAMEVPGTGTVWVVPSAGGQPRAVGANFTNARYPIWSPDSKHLLLIGYAADKSHERSSLDWWLAGIDGGGSVRTGAFDAFVRSGMLDRYSANIPIPQCWSGNGNQVVVSDQAARGAFYISGGGTVNLWAVGISPGTGKVTSLPARLTTSAGNETDPSCAARGVIAFTNLEPENHVWSLPFDLDHGIARGPLERLTTDPIFRDDVTLSPDGLFMAFIKNQLSNRWSLWTRDLATRKETRFGAFPFSLRYPAISPSGDKIAFSGVEKGERTVYVSSLPGTPEKVCEGCIRATDWSRDESKLLVWSGSPYQVNLLDVASHRQTPLLKHPTWSLLFARFSPDNRWVSFTIRTEPNRARIAVAPIDGSAPVSENAWIPIATVDPQDRADWSPDGNTLYYTSNIDGHICFWGQRLDSRSRKPVGDPFAVQHLHGRASYRERGWSAAAGRIVMPLVEETGSIWMMSPTAAR